MEDDNKKMSLNQKEILLSFMEQHLDFARGRLKTTEGRITYKNLWLILVEQLNSTGMQKTMQQWQRTWTDIKIKVKRKVSAIKKASQRKTGGGPMSDIKISYFDDRVIQVISEESVFGIPEPENMSIESEQPAASKPNVPTPENSQRSVDETGSSVPQIKKRAESWVGTTEKMEQSLKKQRTNSILSFPSPISLSESEMEEDSRRVEDELKSPAPRKSCNRSSVAAAAAAELKIISWETNNSVKEMKNEISNLNNNLKKIVEQNAQHASQREVTNQLLLRIAQALEGQSP